METKKRLEKLLDEMEFVNWLVEYAYEHGQYEQYRSFSVEFLELAMEFHRIALTEY